VIGWNPEMVQGHFTLDLEDPLTKEIYMTSSGLDNVSWMMLCEQRSQCRESYFGSAEA